jgi:hypothetical protein
VKIRDNRAVRYKHFGIVGGTGNIITGNHFFQGDGSGTGERSAGMKITTNNCKTTMFGNYIDNAYIEWTNEHDAMPDLITGFSFGGLVITGNIFAASEVANWFRWIHVKPFGTGHFLNGFTVSDNVFKAINGPNIDRVEIVDTTHADLDHSKTRNLTVTGNMYNGVTNRMQNPVTIAVTRNTPDISWVEDVSEFLPFGGRVRKVVAAIPEGQISDALSQAVFEQSYATVGQGTGGVEFNLIWSKAVSGKVHVTLRSDNPT